MNAFEKGTIYEKPSKHWKDITDPMAVYQTKDIILIKTVENQGFK